MLLYFWVGVGGGLGSVARFWFSELIANRWNSSFPYGTLLVNITGSLAIGFLAALTNSDGRFPASSEFRQFFMVGVLGGYTTFSAFSFQTLNLAREGEWLQAGANVILSVILCLVAVWLGHAAGDAFRIAK